MRATPPATLRHTLLLLALFTLLGCADGGKQDFAAQPPGSQNPKLVLPAPSTLLGAIKGVSTQTLSVSGAAFEAAQPHQNVVPAGSQGVFSSTFGTQGGAFGDLAFAVYRLNVAGFSGDPLLRLRTGTPFADRDELFVAFADFDADRWSYRTLPATDALQLDATGFAAANGDILVAVVLAGPGQFKLDELTFNTYDESENNDSIATANPFPSAAFSGFRGSIGTDVSYPGYDGDNADYFTIPYASGDELDYSFAFNSATGGLKYTIMLADGTTFVSSDTSSATGNIKYGFSQLDGPFGTVEQSDFPLTLLIEPLSGYTDYTINLTLDTRPDAVLTADVRQGPAPLTVHFDASGSSDPDGDPIAYEYEIRGGDWNLFNAPDSEIHTADALYAYTFPSDGVYKVTLRAKDPTGLTSLNQDVVILVGSSIYNEVEDNDTDSTPMALDALDPQTGVRGNVGTFDAFDSAHFWDGDLNDFYSLVVPSGKTVCFHLSDSQGAVVPTAGVQFYFTTEDNLLEADSVIDARFAGQLQGIRNSSSAGEPVVVQVAGAGDYTLTWTIGDTPPTIAPTTTPHQDDARTIDFDAHSTAAPGSSISAVTWNFDQNDDDDDPRLFIGETCTYTYLGVSSQFFPEVCVLDANGLIAHQEIELDL